MSSTDLNNLTDTQRHQLASNLAVLMLHDAKTDVTSENLAKILKHSGVDVPSYWP